MYKHLDTRYLDLFILAILTYSSLDKRQITTFYIISTINKYHYLWKQSLACAEISIHLSMLSYLPNIKKSNVFIF